MSDHCVTTTRAAAPRRRTAAADLPTDQNLARAHRDAMAELWILIPWASPAIVRALRKRYRRAFDR